MKTTRYCWMVIKEIEGVKQLIWPLVGKAIQLPFDFMYPSIKAAKEAKTNAARSAEEERGWDADTTDWILCKAEINSNFQALVSDLEEGK